MVTILSASPAANHSYLPRQLLSLCAIHLKPTDTRTKSFYNRCLNRKRLQRLKRTEETSPVCNTASHYSVLSMLTILASSTLRLWQKPIFLIRTPIILTLRRLPRYQFVEQQVEEHAMCLKIVLRARHQQYLEEGFNPVPLTVSRSGSDLTRPAARRPPARPQGWLHEGTPRLRPYTEHRDSNFEKQDWSHDWLKLSDTANIRLEDFELREHLTLASTTSFFDTHSSHPGRDSPLTARVSGPARNHYFSMKDFAKDPLSSPKISALPLAIRRTSMPDVTPFAQFCKMAPPSPSLESSRSNSLDNMETVIPTISERSSCDLEVVAPELSESGSVTEPQLPTLRQAAFEKEPSQILRGQGTGFEILRPGSLRPATSASWKVDTRQRNLMSVLRIQRHCSRGGESIISSQANRRSRISRLFCRSQPDPSAAL